MTLKPILSLAIALAIPLVLGKSSVSWGQVPKLMDRASLHPYPLTPLFPYLPRELQVSHLLIAHYDIDELEAVEKTLKEDPNNAQAYLTRGLIRSHSQEDFPGAIEDFTQAIRLKPTAETYNYRGTAYFWLQQYQKALEDYEQAISLDPNLALAYFNRAYVRLELGNKSGAIEDFRQGATLSQQQGDLFSYQEALKLIQDLEKK